MKLIIAGSRRFEELGLCERKDWIFNQKAVQYIYNIMKDLLENNFSQTSEIVSGRCWGIDLLGEDLAREKRIKVAGFPANWDLYGKSAGYKRNVEMGNYADALLCIRARDSRGSENMVQIMRDLGKPFIERVL